MKALPYILFLVLILRCNAGQLKLGLQEVEKTILPGQTLSITVTLTNTGRIPVKGIFLLEETSFEMIDTKALPGETPIVIPGRGMPEANYPERTINPGEGLSTTLAITYNLRDKDYAFKTSGVYRLTVKKSIGFKDVTAQERKEETLVVENLLVTVNEPTGVDKEVWQVIGNPDFAKLFGSTGDSRARPRLLLEVKALLERFPDSVYSKQLRDLLSILTQ